MNVDTAFRIELVPDDIGPQLLDNYPPERQRQYAAGVFCFVTVRVAVESIDHSTGVTTLLRTAGLHGIESDSGEAWFRQVAADEAATLRTALRPFATVSGDDNTLVTYLDAATAPITWDCRNG